MLELPVMSSVHEDRGMIYLKLLALMALVWLCLWDVTLTSICKYTEWLYSMHFIFHVSSERWEEFLHHEFKYCDILHKFIHI